MNTITEKEIKNVNKYSLKLLDYILEKFKFLTKFVDKRYMLLNSKLDELISAEKIIVRFKKESNKHAF